MVIDNPDPDLSDDQYRDGSGHGRADGHSGGHSGGFTADRGSGVGDSHQVSVRASFEKQVICSSKPYYFRLATTLSFRLATNLYFRLATNLYFRLATKLYFRLATNLYFRLATNLYFRLATKRSAAQYIDSIY